MFRADLSARLHRIFELSRVTFDAPSDAYEQDVLFIEIQDAETRTAQGKAIAKVSGSIVMYSQRDKLPYGFFIKKIAHAEASDTKPFYFYDTDTDALNSPARLINISERRCRFIFLYDEQYDPNQGQLTSIEFEGGFE